MLDADLKGLIPRVVEGIFEGMRNADEHVEFTVRFSLVEIYLEHIRDLLDPSKQNLSIREDKETGIWIEDVTEIYVSSEADVYSLLAAGQQNRSVSATSTHALPRSFENVHHITYSLFSHL